MVPQCIQEYYDIIMRKIRRAAGAKLIFDKIPAVIRCRSCGAESEIERFRLRCPVCNDNKVDLIKGRELYIESLEVEDED